MKKYTLSQHEKYLNQLYSEIMNLDEALEQYGGCVSNSIIIRNFKKNTLGTMMRKQLPIEFYVSYNKERAKRNAENVSAYEQFSFIRIGKKVRWADPEGKTSGVYVVYAISGSGAIRTKVTEEDNIILIGNGYSEAEVIPCELSAI